MDDTRACSNVDVVDRFLDRLTARPGGQGREAVGMLFSMIFGGYGRAEFLDRRIVATADPDVVVARWRTDIDVLASGRRYCAEVIAVVELRDGRITRFTEYFNPDALRAAGVI